jgi:hypothetical protein
MDEAAFLWGRHVEGSMNEAASKAKTDQQRHAARVRVLTSLLYPQEDEGSKNTPPPQGRFRDPAQLMKGGAKKSG